MAGLAIVMGIAIAQLWPSLNLADLRGSLPAFKAAVALEVQRHARAAASLAARQYADARSAAGMRGAFTPIPADPPPVAQVAATVDWAVQPLWNPDVLAHGQAGGTTITAPPVTPPSTTPSTTPNAPDAGSAIADAKARLAAGTERQVLDAGRDTIATNVGRDHKAKGWVRVTEPNPCSFCLMLATRGMVYRSEKSAEFKSHDHCRCHAEPVFTAYEPSADIRAAEALWISSTKGLSGSAARLAFRRAVEGRTPSQ